MGETNQQLYNQILENDNTLKHCRKKQHIFWNLYALSNIHQLSEMLKNNRNPSEHTQIDKDWRDLYFLDQIYVNGKKCRDTFISRAQKYLQKQTKVMDRISWLKGQQFDLKVIKHDFWNRIYSLRPKTKEEAQCKKIVSNVLWKERMSIFGIVAAFSFVFNLFTGISGLSLTRRLMIVGCCLAVGEIVVRYKLSDSIFYRIPKLPDPELENQRKQILNECLFFDGKINNYGPTNPIDYSIFKLLGKQKTRKQQEQLLECLNLNVIKEEDL